jgi:DNA-binding LacI/PurR family transcriptional regulator
MAKVTLQSIADQVGVSRMTVSNAFSRPDQLSAELRARILTAAEELGYVGPDPAARALARGRTGSVGLLLNGRLAEAFEDDVSAEFVASVADELGARGLALTLLTPGHAGKEGYVPARDVAVDGALVYTCDPGSPDLDWLAKRGLPIVTVDQLVREGIPSVNVDDRGGARAAAQHLVELGHTRIGIVTLQDAFTPGPATELATMSRNYPTVERLRGWHEALDAAGIEPMTVVAPYTPRDAAGEAARLLLERDDRPTALLCFSDEFAAASVRVAGALGLSVPGDLSVVGYDDSPLAASLDPPLTTVHQEITAKGRQAVAAIVTALGGTAPEPVLLPTSLVLRGSTAPRRRR